MFAMILLLLAAAGANAQNNASAGALTLTPGAGGEMPAGTALAPGLLQAAGLSVSQGKEKRPVVLSAPRIARQGNGVRIAYTSDAPLSVTLSLASAGRCIVWEVACANTGTAPLWLEVGPWLSLRRSGGLRFFDGWDECDAGEAKLASTRMGGNMPLAVAWNANASVAAGLEPSTLVSYLRNEYEPLPEGRARIACLTRLVIDPGKSETVKFVTCAAPGEWGKMEAFEAYYESFPRWFSPNPEVDPRARLGSTQYRAWPAREGSSEICRRLYGGWDWCYAPFRRTGDIVGRPEHWEYEPVRPFGKDRGRAREEYLSRRKEAFAAGNRKCNTAMMFYIPSQVWCEERLARDLYPDALVKDPKAKTYFDTPWVTGNDNELLVFPYKTSFAEQSYKDMRQVAEGLELSGFAFDTAGGVARYTGPALSQLEGRAWDDEVGVYCSEMVAIAHLMEFVHTLRKDGRPLAVVANPMAYGSYASCFHCDSAMLEGSPWGHERTLADRLRWKMGQKTLVWWEGYDVEDFVDKDTVQPDQLTRVYQGLADFTLLQSLRIGYIPTPGYTQGVTRLVRWLPAITECVQAGWQPVPAARVPDPLWSSRYGRGLQTLLAIAHETGKPVSADVAIENGRLAQGALLFTEYHGGLLRNAVRGGETTVHLDVPVRTPVLLRARIEVLPAGTVTAADVKERVGATERTLAAEFDGSGPATLRVGVPAGMRLASATWNGAPVKAAQADGIATLRVRLSAGARLVAAFRSETLALGEGDLLEYPFAKEGKPACAILLPPNAGDRERLAAFRVQEYFRYWHGRALRPGSEMLLPIREAGEGAAGPVVRLQTGAGLKPRVSRKGQDLLLQAADGAALDATVLALLRALDTKYWTPDWFGNTAVQDALAAYGRDEKRLEGR